jgi:hypothetical protein
MPSDLLEDPSDAAPIAGATPPAGLPFVRVVDTQGRILGLHFGGEDTVTLSFETGRGSAARALDRFQTKAFLDAAFALGEMIGDPL